MRLVLVSLTLLTLTNFVHGQDSPSHKRKKFEIQDIRDIKAIEKESPLFIVHVDNKVLQIPVNGNLSNTRRIRRTLKHINPDWVTSIEVIKDKKAVETYGSLGRNGVVILRLKEGVFDNLPRKLQRKCKPTK